MTQTDSLGNYPRTALVGAGLVVVTAVLFMRLVYLGAVAANDVAPDSPRETLPACRGSLWDAHGHLIATEVYVYDVYAATNEIADSGGTAASLAEALTGYVPQGLPDIAGPQPRWVLLARDVAADTAAALDQLDLDGIYAEPKPRRWYALGADAAHATGFVNSEGKGYYGIEGFYDRELSGERGDLVGNRGTDPRSYRPPLNGTDLVLTVDRHIQLAAARALEDVVREQSATGGTILVMVPATGAILASVSLPSHDPNDYGAADSGLWPDPAVSQLYEPGSVVKAMTMAAALDAGVAGVESTYDDGGFVTVAGVKISNWDRTAHGRTSMTELLRYSLNVGAVQLAQSLGPERFYGYVGAFGYGQPTGVDLAGEVAGLIHRPEDELDWFAGHLATNSFGQGMAATPMQVAAAMSAIANDGRLMAPFMVGARIDREGRTEASEPRLVRQVVAPATARALRGMLEEVVDGRVTKAAVPGYSVGGKTGTSQIPVHGGYDPVKTIASFVGFLPVNRPEVVILVKVDRPDAPRGSDVAAPVFREVAETVIQALDIAPDRALATTGDEA